ncbi:MAG: hypothetical protein PHY04_03925 [Candidatus ainarchaeum sp.]|jgi:hypothetical protein|nr:hypothetical protein [Candidatus ainarchaeum sp.]MDD3086011.1 hypothetical protein [Candidatus ainarchaeum sp.]MDD4128856.1 hypothetical protein [Candidatus ainarchaeum sp.]MDD4468001.1 hypothetical protein [Candidatus ainarchaeum sp.]HPM86234.1 hypothetical protein [archaeon]
MGLVDWLNKKHKKTDIWDTGFTKWSVFFFTLMVVKFWPVLLSLEWYVYLVLFLLLAIRPMYHMFLSK